MGSAGMSSLSPLGRGPSLGGKTGLPATSPMGEPTKGYAETPLNTKQLDALDQLSKALTPPQ